MTENATADDALALADRLSDWLAARRPEADSVEIHELTTPTGGYSAETWIVPATVRSGGEEHAETFVLRRETPETGVYPLQNPDHDVEVVTQRRVMAAIGELSDLPVAGIVGHDDSSETLGAPFFVMEFVDGDIPGEDPPYAQEGFYVEMDPDERRSMILNGVRTVAAIHAIDPDTAELDFLRPPDAEPTARHHCETWAAFLASELDGRELPVADEALAWLRERAPQNEPILLNWGDARLGNIIWQGTEPACVTDFEAACFGPPGLDLGWWLMFDRWIHGPMGSPEHPGEPTHDEQVAAYVEASGREIPDLLWHEIFAAFRYCVILVRVMNRLVERGLLPDDHTVWRDNPCTQLLREYLDEL